MNQNKLNLFQFIVGIIIIIIIKFIDIKHNNYKYRKLYACLIKWAQLCHSLKIVNFTFLTKTKSKLNLRLAWAEGHWVNGEDNNDDKSYYVRKSNPLEHKKYWAIITYDFLWKSAISQRVCEVEFSHKKWLKPEFSTKPITTLETLRDFERHRVHPHTLSFTSTLLMKHRAWLTGTFRPQRLHFVTLSEHCLNYKWDVTVIVIHRDWSSCNFYLRSRSFTRNVILNIRQQLRRVITEKLT